MIGPKLVNRSAQIRNFNTLSSFAKSFRDRVIARGGTIDPKILQKWDVFFFKPALLNGNILNQCDQLFLYAGLDNEIAALTNVISNNFHATKVNSPIWNNSEGFKSGGTGYLNLNFKQLTNGNKFKRNDNINFFGTKNPLWTTNYRGKGILDTTIGSARMEVSRDVSRLANYNNSFSVYYNTNTASGKVFTATRRTSASGPNCEQSIINKTLVNSSNSSTGNTDLNMFELCINVNGTPTGAFDIIPHMYSGLGSKDFDYSAFQDLINNTYNKLGI